MRTKTCQLLVKLIMIPCLVLLIIDIGVVVVVIRIVIVRISMTIVRVRTSITVKNHPSRMKVLLLESTDNHLGSLDSPGEATKPTAELCFLPGIMCVISEVLQVVEISKCHS